MTRRCLTFRRITTQSSRVRAWISTQNPLRDLSSPIIYRLLILLFGEREGVRNKDD